MKAKGFIVSALFLCLCLVCTVTAIAHSGRTDGDGGHYNRSTGEYHWHHGYDDHQHEDLDGDGDLDCPITFTPAPTPSPRRTQMITDAPSRSQTAPPEFIFSPPPIVTFDLPDITPIVSPYDYHHRSSQGESENNIFVYIVPTVIFGGYAIVCFVALTRR